MQRLLTSSIIALAAAVSVSAQDTTIKSETRIKADDAKAITVTGCLGGGPSTFVVTNVATAEAAGKRSRTTRTRSAPQVSWPLIP